jgi:nitroreductase
MASVGAVTPPLETESTRPLEAESTRPLEREFRRAGLREPNGRTVMVHLFAVQTVWLAAIAFGIYSAAHG